MTIQVLLAQPGGHTRYFPGGMLPNGEHILGCEGGILTCSVYHILGAVPQPGQFEWAMVHAGSQNSWELSDHHDAALTISWRCPPSCEDLQILTGL